MKKYIIDAREVTQHRLHEKVTMPFVIDKVARYFKLAVDGILFAPRGTGKKNISRHIAMHLCKQHTEGTLIEIATLFNVKHYSTVSKIIGRLIKEQPGNRKIDKFINVLCQNLAI